VLLWLFLCKHQLNGPQCSKKTNRRLVWEWRSKSSRKHFDAISNTEAHPRLTYPMPIVGENRAEQEERESSEVERASRQPEQQATAERYGAMI